MTHSAKSFNTDNWYQERLLKVSNTATLRETGQIPWPKFVIASAVKGQPVTLSPHFLKNLMSGFKRKDF